MGIVGSHHKEVRREPVHRAPPGEYPVSVLVLRSYAAQRRRSTDAAACHDCRLPRQVSAYALNYQDLLPRGLGGLPPALSTGWQRLNASRSWNRPNRREDGVEPFYQRYGSCLG